MNSIETIEFKLGYKLVSESVGFFNSSNKELYQGKKYYRTLLHKYKTDGLIEMSKGGNQPY